MIGTLRSRLILSVAAVHAIMMSLFVLDSTVRQGALLLENQTIQTIALSQTLATSAAGWLAAADVAGLQELIDSEKRYPELRFALLTDTTGFVLAHSDPTKVGNYVLDLPSANQQTILHRSTDLVDVAVPVLMGTKPVGWARVGIGQEEAVDRLSRLAVVGFSYTLVAVLIGSIVAWFLGRQITRRIYTLMETVSQVKAGGRQIRSALKGKDEAATLAHEFNAMLEKLDERDEALRQSEEKYRSLLATIPVAVVVHGPESRIQLCNQMASTLLGLTEDQILGKSVRDPAWRFLREDGSVLPQQEYPAAWVSQTRQPLRDKIVGIDRSGSGDVVWVLVDGDPVMASDGTVAQVIVTFFDITERKKIEALLHQSADRIQDLYDHAPCGYHSLAPDGTIVQINDTELGWLGYSREEVVGKMKFSDWVGPEGQKTFAENFPRLKASGKVTDLEFDLIRRDGTILPVSVNATAIYNEKGEYLSSRSVVNDITMRRQADLELRNLTLRTDMILNSAGEGIYGTDLEGRIVFFNQAAQAMLGFSEGEAVGQISHNMFHHTRADGTPFPVEDCALQQSLLQGKTLRMAEDLFWTREGKALPVELVNSPLVDRGASVGAVVVFRDITLSKRASAEIHELNTHLEQRVKEGVASLQDSQTALINIVEDLNEKTAELESANEKLKDLDRLKSLFIASMSHEFRTPLNSVIGFSTILLNEWTGNLTGEQKDILSIILRSGRHLLALVSDVIDVSKIEAGKLESTKEDFDAYDAGFEAMSAFTEEAKKKDLQIEFHGVHQPVYSDRRRLLQCLLNLISNAVKYTDQGKVDVEVRLVDEGAFVEFRVEDTGIGISPEDLEKLFSPFVRIILPQRPVVPGTGLGLYLSRKLAQEVLGGDIEVQSVRGEGSCFVLKIPVTERRPG